MKRAVIYYSLDGNTKEAAQKIAESLGAALIELEPEKPMPSGKISRILYGGMLSTMNRTPALKPLSANLADFDEIILGTPVWAGKIAAPVRTFLTQNIADEKVIAVFTLSGSADDAKCLADLRHLLHNIRYTATLADRSSTYAEGNAVRLKKFLAALAE